MVMIAAFHHQLTAKLKKIKYSNNQLIADSVALFEFHPNYRPLLKTAWHKIYIKSQFTQSK